MFSIRNAQRTDAPDVSHIGRISVEYAHRDSCSTADLTAFLDRTYSHEEIEAEISDPLNIYRIIEWEGVPVGFSKIILNAAHQNISGSHVAKLDRIYLLPEYVDRKLGRELLKFNIDFTARNHQTGIWLFTWVGNHRAINFYHKAGFRIIAPHRFKVTETHYNEHYQMLLDFGDLKSR